jgi:hypothetical protein
MNPALHDNTWTGCGTSPLWDADALMLQRELEHRGLSKGSRGYEARLIGWVEAKVPLTG